MKEGGILAFATSGAGGSARKTCAAPHAETLTQRIAGLDTLPAAQRPSDRITHSMTSPRLLTPQP